MADQPTNFDKAVEAALQLTPDEQRLLGQLVAGRGYIETKWIKPKSKAGKVYGAYAYRYLRWRENGRLRSKYLGRVED